MQRPIKFRAWDKKRKRFVYADLKQLLVTAEGEQYIRYDEFGKLDWFEYTGLHDKNGVEIYEGDILRGKLAVADPDEPFITNALAVVVWFQSNVEYILVDADEYTHGNLDEPAYMIDGNQGWPSLEVIGNIYENPELVKGRDE